MQLQVNPHALILIGENSFIRLSTDGGKNASTRCSHWRVLWTPEGTGHALFVDSGVTGGVRIYGDSVPVIRFLQKEIEYLLYKPFGDTALPVIPATFKRQGTPPETSSELVHTDKDEIRLSWSEFLEPFNFAADPGYDGRPIGVQTTFFPAGAAEFSVAGKRAEGQPWKMDRGGKACTTACLAWCESWFRPK
ncbi:hypothetical protein AYO44_03535 [Planctomycetaceae bacterium SCGC AG-212-F19]|nr:hypothetical protein AYO44_03535 [Planctomycetaceae bacterium SCGC AG-212-F19]